MPRRILVDPSVSRAKIGRELESWRRNEADYRRKGWVMLRDNLDDLFVEVGFLALIPMGSIQIPIILPTIRLDYDNYDLLPPSMSFIDIFTGQPTAAPFNQALVPGPDGQDRNVLITNTNGKQFLCFAGIREYHEHPDHNGDAWLLYRHEKRGSIAVICERIWETMTSAVAGIQFQMQPSLLAPSSGLPLAQAQDLARKNRAVYDAHVAAYASELEQKAVQQ